MSQRRSPVYDQVVCFPDGFYAMVEGKLHGPWPMKEYAQAGMRTEQRRAEARRRKEAAREAGESRAAELSDIL